MQKRAQLKQDTVKTAKQIGHKLLTETDHVKAAVEDGLSKHNSKVEITRDLVLEGLHREATGAEGDSSASSRSERMVKFRQVYRDGCYARAAARHKLPLVRG